MVVGASNHSMRLMLQFSHSAKAASKFCRCNHFLIARQKETEAPTKAASTTAEPPSNRQNNVQLRTPAFPPRTVVHVLTRVNLK